LISQKPDASQPNRLDHRSAYLWIFIFKRERWPLHRYEIVGAVEPFGRSAVVSRFEPLPPYRAGEAVRYWTYYVERIATEFKIEERGMRFPSRADDRFFDVSSSTKSDGLEPDEEPNR